MNTYTIFDLETAPIADAGTYVEPVSAPSNYTKAESIAAYVAKAEAEQISKCALDPDLCRIVALGWHYNDIASISICPDEASERHWLTAFWKEAADSTLVGFNCLGFDLPVLLRRSLYLGVDAPKIQIDRFRHPDVIDLMQLLSFNGAIKAHSLSFYTNRFALPVVEDNVTGAEIPELVNAGDWQAIENHCRADVLRTLHLARRIGVVPVQQLAETF